MNISSFFNPEEALEQGQTLVKKQAQATAQAVKGQVTGQSQQQTPSDSSGAKPPSPGQDKLTQEFLQDMYAPSDNQPLAGSQQPQTATTLQAQLQANTSNNDQNKLADARKKLAEHKKQHMELYYKPTFEKKQKEERPAEKVEREEQEEKQKRWELQQQEKKKQDVPMAVQMTAKKAEMFRGAAG